MGHGASKNENEGQNVNSVIVNESIEIYNDDLLRDVKVIMWWLCGVKDVIIRSNKI